MEPLWGVLALALSALAVGLAAFRALRKFTVQQKGPQDG